jgi:hypothetical protein
MCPSDSPAALFHSPASKSADGFGCLDLAETGWPAAAARGSATTKRDPLLTGHHGIRLHFAHCCQEFDYWGARPRYGTARIDAVVSGRRTTVWRTSCGLSSVRVMPFDEMCQILMSDTE